MERRGANRVERPENQHHLDVIRNLPPVNIATIHTLKDLSEQTYALRRTYHLLALAKGSGTVDRWGEGERTVESFLPFEEKNSKELKEK